MSDNGNHPDPPAQPPPMQMPPWMALGFPMNWDPNLPVSYAFVKVPGVVSGPSRLPVFALVIQFAGQQIQLPFTGPDLDTMVKNIQEVKSGLILP